MEIRMTEILLGGILPLFLLSVGIYFLIYLKAYPLRSPQKFCKALFSKGDDGDVSPMQALLTALAGTLGVGNISGVAAAIALGGAGALFWMWICALFAMIIKYAEIVLALSGKKGSRGGAMYYIKNKFPAMLFALFCLSCGFAMGNMTQVKAAADAMETGFGGSGSIVALLFALLLPPILWKGKSGVFRFAQKAVPFMTVLYCSMAILHLFLCRHALPNAFLSIFRSAFSFRSVSGGFFGSALFLGMRYGACRGMISNEAGCGTAPIAHAASRNHPAAQGCMGVAEVFIDTILLCTLTGLCVLVSPTETVQSGTALVVSAFASQFGNMAGYLLAPAMTIFAFATTVCWFYYSAECLYFITGKSNFEKPLAILFSVLCPIALLFSERSLLFTADLLICFMALINLPTLCKHRRRILQETLAYFAKK